jgi:hypothetical protein
MSIVNHGVAGRCLYAFSSGTNVCIWDNRFFILPDRLIFTLLARGRGSTPWPPTRRQVERVIAASVFAQSLPPCHDPTQRML